MIPSKKHSSGLQQITSWIRTQRTLILFVFLGLAALGVGLAMSWVIWQQQSELATAAQRQIEITSQYESTSQQLAETQQELATLQNEDQRARNNTLQEEISSIQKTYAQSVKVYESLLDLRGDGGKTQPLEALFAKSLTFLANRNYSSASATIITLEKDIATQRQALAAAVVPTNTPISNTPPAAGSVNRQVVDTSIGQYAVDLIAADLNSTKVVVETASENTCGNDCPVNSLAAFVASAGGYAGINGPYFCPAEYPSCAGKTNSFDTLLMNRKKTYFNSDNNVYSSVPAMIFSDGSARLVSKSQEWGRDTGVDSVIASQPMLLSGGNIMFGGDGDPKKGSRGNRSFIGTKDSTVYIGVVRNATVAEVAHVLKALGLQSALNLDSGGSTALYSGGRYLAGPGRNTPFGIVFVKK